MKDVILIHRMDENNRIRRMRFVTDAGMHERADQMLALLEKANLTEEDLVFLRDGFTARLTREDIPRVLSLVLATGMNVYSVYEVYELYES